MKCVELEGRQSLSSPDVVALEEGSLSLERGSPWMTSFVIGNPQKEVFLKTKSHGQDQQIHAEMEDDLLEATRLRRRGPAGGRPLSRRRGSSRCCFVS